MAQESTPISPIKKPLGKSITIGCVLFIALLSLFLGVSMHISYKKSLYLRYQSYITDILKYVERHIDHDDLRNCVMTRTRSSQFDRLELFMDGIIEDFDIHYLYIIKPLAIRETKNVMSVMSAENYYNRYVDTSENLFLGWISDDEFDIKTVKKFFSVMEQRNIQFFEEKTGWSTDYTGALALLDSNKSPYAVLAVDVEITDLNKQIWGRTIMFAAIICLSGILFTSLFLFWAKKNITTPIRLLEKSVADFAANSHGKRSTDGLEFLRPDIHTQNEVECLTDAVTLMTEDMRIYVTGLIDAERKTVQMQQEVKQMSELANKDTLTGIRNKTAYDREIKKIEYDLNTGKEYDFGIGMVDLNFLKRINDTYGHEKGNIAIKKLCTLVCTIFDHSPVFRIGGDEFVIILKGTDYTNYDNLYEAFTKALEKFAADARLEPWEKVSAAIGAAFYDKNIDASVDNVFRRADQKMYQNKKAMKAVRMN